MEALRMRALLVERDFPLLSSLGETLVTATMRTSRDLQRTPEATS